MAKKSVDINVDLMRGAILTVWNAIAPDLAELGGMTNTSAVECCIDADRLTFFAGYGERGKAEAAAADAELHRAVDAFGYDRVLRKLAREISLV